MNKSLMDLKNLKRLGYGSTEYILTKIVRSSKFEINLNKKKYPPYSSHYHIKLKTIEIATSSRIS